MDEYKIFKNKLLEGKKKEGKRNNDKINQECDNLTESERRGLSKLRKRIQKGEIVVVKTDKSGKLAVMEKEKYRIMGLKGCLEDRKIDRQELLKIEKKLNDHTRMLLKVFNAGESHNHLTRITNSKIVNSENTASKYYLFKDHKEKESWRPVVSGCTSNTLGLSNLLSDVVESLCSSVSKPYEVISSEDMLSRVEVFNGWVENMNEKKKKENINWDWRDEWILIGSDVVSLFPSLTADRTAKAVRS